MDVPKNREKFRAYYVELLKDYMQNKEIVAVDNPKASYLEADEIAEDSDGQENHPNKPHRKEKELKLTKIKETYSSSDVSPSLYYYKRWIWIQFPWACISLQNDYSKTPELCLTSATEYMSVESEAEFTRQALKIAIEAKERKKLMFTKKCEDTTLGKRLQMEQKAVQTSQLHSRDQGSTALKSLDNCSTLGSGSLFGKSKLPQGIASISLSSLTK